MSQSPSDPAALREALIGSPALCPLEWNGDRTAVLFGRLSAAEYQATSFLDRRAIQPEMATGTVPWPLAEPWLLELPRRCDFIFHISHCGSTLLSRLLGSHEATLPVREPGILRGLRLTDSQARFDATLGLLSRGFRPGQQPLVKATSVVNAVAERLMERADNARALLVHVPASTFLAAVLDGSQSDILGHAAERHHRLVQAGLLPTDTPAAGPGEQAAAAWLCEMHTLRGIAARFPDRARWLNFDTFLAEPVRVLGDAFDWLSSGIQDSDLQALLAGPLMRRYAKRTDVVYDASSRAGLLAASRLRFAPEIAAGIDWLERHESPAPSSDTSL